MAAVGGSAAAAGVIAWLWANKSHILAVLGAATSIIGYSTGGMTGGEATTIATITGALSAHHSDQKAQKAA